MNLGIRMRTALQPVPELSRQTAAKALLSAALAACPEAVAVVEAGKILWCNAAHTHLFGYSHSRELAGRPLADLLPEH